METNFKVDMPSFALGFNTGKKNAKKPILTELTVTENGVYDDPTIGGGLEPITWDGVLDPNTAIGYTEFGYLSKVSNIIPTREDLIGATVELSNGLSGTILQDSFMVGDEKYPFDEEHALIVWVYFERDGKTFRKPYVVIFTGINENIDGLFLGRDAWDDSYVTSLTFPSTPADGWNKVTVNVQSDMELNIAYGSEPPEDTTKLWVKTAEPNGVLISPEVEETEVGGESYYKLRTTLPYPVAYAGCGVVGSKIYIIGGTMNDGTGNKASKSVIVYDTEKGTFEELKDVLGEGIVNICCAVVGTRIYFVGGGASFTTTSKKIRYFDTVTKELVTCGAEMPTALYGFVCGSIENSVYIFGGYNGTFPQTAYCYDTVNDTYSSLGNVKYTWNARIARIGSKFYIFGDDNGPSYVLCYDVDTKQTTYTNISGLGSVNGCAGGILGDYLYWISGQSSNNIYRVNADNHIYGYKEQLPITTPKRIARSACVTFGNKIYMFGGSDSGSTTISPTDEVNVYSLATPVPYVEEGSIYVKPTTEENIFPVVKAGGMTVEIGVDSVYKGNAEGIGEPVEAALYNGNEWETI